MDTLEVIQKRYSCRSYKSNPVTSELLMKLVDAARFAPSGRGRQPWKFVIVSDPSLLKQIAKLASNNAPFVAKAAACVAVFCERDARYAVEDGSAATTTLMLAATGLGLGSCWVAGDKKPYAAEVEKLLKAPDSHKLISLVAVGFPADEPPAERAKKSLEEVLHWQKF